MARRKRNNLQMLHAVLNVLRLDEGLAADRVGRQAHLNCIAYKKYLKILLEKNLARLEIRPASTYKCARKDRGFTRRVYYLTVEGAQYKRENNLYFLT